jgi:HSP20 family protein
MPWDPMADLLTMQERLESLLGRATPGWVPPVDLAEYPDRYELTVEVSGLCREDVHLEFQDQTLTVTGDRQGSSECPERFHQLERGQGHFSRSFRFSKTIRPDDISADLVNGILKIVVPRADENREIEIS